MNKLLILIILLMLSGCFETIMPVKRTFPTAPPILNEACPMLKELPADTSKLSEFMKTVTENYSKYYQCRVKIDAWLEWHRTQKELFDNIR